MLRAIARWESIEFVVEQRFGGFGDGTLNAPRREIAADGQRMPAPPRPRLQQRVREQRQSPRLFARIAQE